MPHRSTIRLVALSLLPVALAITMPLCAQAPPAPSPATTASAPITPAAPAAGGILRGTVIAGDPAGPSPVDTGAIKSKDKSQRIPLPGVTITATNTLTGTRYATATDSTGAFAMAIPRNGRYVLRASFAAFAEATKEALLNAASHEQQVDFSLQLASRAAAQSSGASGLSATQLSALGSAAQALNLSSSDLSAIRAGLANGSLGANSGASLPSIAADAATDSVTVSGQTGTTSPFAGITQDMIENRMDEERQNQRLSANSGRLAAQGGSGLFGGGDFGAFNSGGGPGGGPAGGFGGFGGRGGGLSGFRRFDPTKPHGAIYYSGLYSPLDAQPFAINGPALAQPFYNNNRFGATFIGSPSIPGLVKPSTRNTVFFNLAGVRNTSPFNQYATVPTLAERSGDFSAQANPIYDPATGQPISYQGRANVLDPNRITSQAKALLAFIPAPTLPGTVQNFRTVTTAATNSTIVGLRFIRNLSPGGGMALPDFLQARRGANAPKTVRQNINFNGNYSHSAADSINIFPQLGGSTATTSWSAVAGYTIGYGRLNNNLSLTWNRSNTEARNYFTNKTDVAANSGIQLGVTGGNTPFNYGSPNVVFSNFQGLNQYAPSQRIGQTISFSDNSSWSRGKHNLRFGMDYRYIHSDVHGTSNVTGTFYFTGFATAAPNSANSGTSTGASSSANASSSGLDFADFLLGLPQEAALQASNQKYYLRANSWDLFLQDDWRILPKFSINAGLRYEYFSPYSEKFNRLANLDFTSDLSQVVSVLPDGISPIGGRYPRSLVYPDRNNFSPRIGIAWRTVKTTVVRAGYGLNYNNGQYSSLASQLSNQPPFANSFTNLLQATSAPTLSLATGLAGPVTTATGITNNYSVNPHYRLGYVQVWNIDIQQTLPQGIVLNIGYNGAKGTRLDLVRAPNRTATSLLNPGAPSFNYEDDISFSNFNALAISARRRLAQGISLQATYQYSHSIDNASSIGGTSTVVAQDDNNLLAELGNSSFDIRHKVNGSYLYEFPLGPNQHFLSNGWAAHAFSGLSLSGDFTFATGTPLTPHYAATASDVGRGSAGTLRPNRVPGTSLTAGGGTQSRWFNTGAFTAPLITVDGTQQLTYGNASRNSIPGPGTVKIDASFAKTIGLGDIRSLEFRITGANIFNTVQYSGVDSSIGSIQSGRVTSAATMRQFTINARYRF